MGFPVLPLAEDTSKSVPFSVPGEHEASSSSGLVVVFLCLVVGCCHLSLGGEVSHSTLSSLV